MGHRRLPGSGGGGSLFLPRLQASVKRSVPWALCASLGDGFMWGAHIAAGNTTGLVLGFLPSAWPSSAYGAGAAGPDFPFQPPCTSPCGSPGRQSVRPPALCPAWSRANGGLCGRLPPPQQCLADLPPPSPEWLELALYAPPRLHSPHQCALSLNKAGPGGWAGQGRQRAPLPGRQAEHSPVPPGASPTMAPLSSQREERADPWGVRGASGKGLAPGAGLAGPT